MSISQVTTRDTQLEKQRIGKPQLSLTNFSNTLEPAVAAGSVIEVGGSLYTVTVDEAITGWAGIANDTDCYIKMVPGSPMTAVFVTAAPTWSHAKQGWYVGNDRYVAGLHRGASAAAYEDKWVYQRSQNNNANHRFLGDGSVEFDNGIIGDLTGGIVDTGSGAETLKVKVLDIGDWNMDATSQVFFAHGITWSKFRTASVVIRSDGSYAEVFPLNAVDSAGVLQGGIEKLNATNIFLRRLAGGIFDNLTFNDTSYNRGYVTLWYAE
jgi:hypothetical protein